MASVTFQNIFKVYPGGVTAVSDFNLKIRDKEFVVLVGPSGCGKSTTLRMVAGLEEITKGELFIGERRVNDVPPKDRDIAMVFQNYALYPHMTVYDNMAFGLKLRKTPKAEIDNRVKEAAAILGIEHLLNRKPNALSGGQKQRVALGRAIVREPRVFLMDEPLSNLDAKLRVQMRTEITRLHQRLQTTFIYVTHDQTEAMTMGDRIVVMKDGFMQQVDSPQNLYDYPVNQFVAGFIGTPPMNFIPVTLVKEGADVYAMFGTEEETKTKNLQKIKVPEGKVKKFKDPSYIGKEVMLGIRPEDLHDEEIFLQSAADSTVKAYVDVVELMGSETFLYLNMADVDGTITARVDPRSTARMGDTIRIAMDPNRLHFFDLETEESILVK